MEEINQENKIPEGGIPVAIDTPLFFHMTMLCSKKCDPTGEIWEGLKNGNLDAGKYMEIPKEDWPPILRDGVLGTINKDGNYDKAVSYRFTRLESAFKLLNYIKTGILRPFITPIVYQQVERASLHTVFTKYCTIIKIPDEEYDDFSSKREVLAMEYIKRGAMWNKTNDMIERLRPTDSARKMAEASILGLVFLTPSTKEYINDAFKGPDGLYKRQLAIETVNKECGYVFEDNNGNTVASRPYFISAYITKLERFLRGEIKRSTIYLNGENIND